MDLEDLITKIFTRGRTPRGGVCVVLFLGQAISIFVGLGKLGATGGDLQQQAAFNLAMTLLVGLCCVFSYLAEVEVVMLLATGLWSTLFHGVLTDAAIFQADVYDFRGCVGSTLAFTLLLHAVSLPLSYPLPKFEAFSPYSTDWIFGCIAVLGSIFNWMKHQPSLEVVWWAALLGVCRLGQWREGMIVAFFSFLFAIPHFMPIPQNCYFLSYGQSSSCKSVAALGDAVLWIAIVLYIVVECYRVHTGYPLFGGGEAGANGMGGNEAYYPPSVNLDEPPPFSARSENIDAGYYRSPRDNYGNYTPRDGYTPRDEYTPRNPGQAYRDRDFDPGLHPPAGVGYYDEAPTRQKHGNVDQIVAHNNASFEDDENL